MAVVGAIMVPHPPLIVPEVGKGGEKQIEATSKAYREAAALAPARAPVDLPDLVCELAQTAGRRFADAHRHIGFVAWLVRERGDRHPACIEPCGDMPAETRTVLERLVDAGWGA